MSEFRFAVNVLPKPGILDPQGRAVELSLPHLKVTTVSRVRVGRRVELTATADAESEARALVDGLAKELLSNPLIESYTIELLEATSSVAAAGSGHAVTRS
jgi:phosphoribosylformylglycinamidine synthase PurS subunit